MPWTPAQHRLFEAAAHNPKIAKKKGIKQSDAKRMASEGIKSKARKPRVLTRTGRGPGGGSAPRPVPTVLD